MRPINALFLLSRVENICLCLRGSRNPWRGAGFVDAASLPPNIDQELIDSIPDTPGCYIFYGENRVPLYIGKSISLRSRVMGHFQGALTQRKEMKLSLQVRDIDWIETGGELGALILESQLIKERMPMMNIKLRRSKDLCAWSLEKDSNGILKPTLVNQKDLLQNHSGKKIK